MYYVIYGFLYLISLLPLRVLYLISDGVYFLIYYIIGYRKKVVFKNLDIVFPHKSAKEKTRIAKNFYHKFIDSLIETLKLLSASDAFFEKRFKGNWEEVNKHYESGRAVQLHLGHNFNWEWGNVAGAKKLKAPLLGVYMPIANKNFDRLFRKIRSRSGTGLLSAHNMARDFIPYRGKQYCLGLVADQSPGGRMGAARWFPFFNRLTAFTVGPAKGAIANDCVIVFAFIHRPKRGYYEVVFSEGHNHPASSNADALTYDFVKYLEQVIKDYPDMWLWSHNRFKHVWSEAVHGSDKIAVIDA